MKTTQPATAEQVEAMDEAIAHLKIASRKCREAGATRTLDRILAALKSADGGRRHVWSRFMRTARAAAATETQETITQVTHGRAQP